MAKKTLVGKTGSQIAVEKGAVGETAAQMAAAIDAVISNDDKAKGGKENSLVKVKIPVFNNYFTYTYLPELFFEQLDVKNQLTNGGVPDTWNQLVVKPKTETTVDRNKRPPGESGGKRRVIGKKVVIPLVEGNEIEQTNVGRDNKTPTKRNIYLRFPSICPHLAIAIWLSKVIATGKMPPNVLIEKLRVVMPYKGEYTELKVPNWVTKND